MKNYKQFDYIIIGAGTSGCVIARRLLDHTNATVLLLEAGDGDPMADVTTDPDKWYMSFGTNIDYRYSYAPQPFLNNRVIPVPRGKLLGGSSSINGLIWARGSHADYDGWAAEGNESWDYQSVLPLFKRVEDWEGGETAYHGQGGPIHVEKVKNPNYIASALIRAAASFGLPIVDDMSGPNPYGAGALVRNVKNGKRSSAYTGYLLPVLHNPNLTVITGSAVTKLILEGSKCMGVKFIKDGQQDSAYAASEVILSAGSFDSPRILMLSGIGDPDELSAVGIKVAHGLRGVGKNMQDHPNLAILAELKKGSATDGLDLQISTVFAKSSYATYSSDLMFIAPPFPLTTPAVAEKYPIPQKCFSIISCLMLSESRGYVKMLSNSPFGPLEIQPNMFTQTADLKAMVEAVRIALNFSEQPALKEITQKIVGLSPLSSDKEIIDYIKLATASYWHPIGTCRMGREETDVVDAKLKVHGIEGLRVADASIMPKITSGNTHAPTLMIGEHLATDLLATDV
ncbi:GMC family oxidoreductase [Mucilaginibacter sp. X4EP1]|uniref:GMC family oxidoreductase n=1 Tax=Mucilaginibacter sp. X4EP1 TaxID=2723092 RepID=UPI002168605F|nr:GMC family oxidoreductase N-terminal domain-containing protein [Mucilaginibacter sp. X4EP1]MCS3813459.1 choline dehydrogenase [Mucilaginibacter sp. X4EP1]